MVFSELPLVKIETKDGNTKLTIDGKKIDWITGIKAVWDTSGEYAKINIEMLANVEIEANSDIKLSFDDLRKFTGGN